MKSRGLTICLFLSCILCSCIGSTGYQIVTFNAQASGPADAKGGQLELTSGLGWHVVLTKATLHVGAVYLDQSTVVSGAQVTQCILPGTYVGQVTSGVDIDMLSSTPTAFPTLGEGTTLPALSAQIWLTHGDVNEAADEQPILVLEGTADKNGDTRPFTASITIGQERLGGGTTSAGEDAICKQRIVSPPANVTLGQGGTLRLTVDPRFLFAGVEFEQLTPSSDGNGYAFKNDSSDQPSRALYSALRATSSLYSFSWSP